MSWKLADAKIVRTHKNYLTPEIWDETHLREVFYGTLIFPQSSMICICRRIGGHALALQNGGQNCFLIISCSTSNSYAHAVNVITSYFQHFPWRLSAKFVFRERYFTENSYKTAIISYWRESDYKTFFH